jgi:hypothetical protein
MLFIWSKIRGAPSVFMNHAWLLTMHANESRTAMNPGAALALNFDRHSIPKNPTAQLEDRPTSQFLAFLS